MNELIRSHKSLNQSIITTPNEATLKLFMGLLGEFNRQEEYKDLEFSKMRLWELFKPKENYTTKYFDSLVNILTKSETYNLKFGKKISGSVFIIEEIEENIKIHIPEPFRKYIFNSKDLKLMSKAKKNSKMSIRELEYYDKEVKMKSKELVLLNKAHILGLKGKYNVRLYTLLKQWDKIGKYEKNWNEFKEIMEIPKSYKATDIEERIFKKAKSELLKANIKITKIEKKKKGRSIDKIIIHFKSVNSGVLEHKGKVGEVEIADNGNEGLENSELNDFKRAVGKLTTNFEIKSLVMGCRSFEEVHKIISKYQLNN